MYRVWRLPLRNITGRSLVGNSVTLLKWETIFQGFCTMAYTLKYIMLKGVIYCQVGRAWSPLKVMLYTCIPLAYKP